MEPPGSHDMLGIGADCSAPDCREHDFLPFKCDACQQHRSNRAHSCRKAQAKQVHTIVCPLCAKAIKLAPDEDANVAFAKHSAEACDPQNYAKVHAKPKCPCPGCREKLTSINKYRCKDCGTEVCLKHRFPADHDCSSRCAAMRQQQQNPLAAAMRSALGWAGAPAAGAASSAAASKRKPAAKAAPRAASEARQAAAAAAPARPEAPAANRAAALAAQQRMSQQPGAPRQQGDAAQQAGQAPERCPQCGEGFGTLQELLFHVDALHPSDGRQGSAGPERCPHCSQSFRDAVELVSHVERNHSQQLNKVCVVS